MVIQIKVCQILLSADVPQAGNSRPVMARVCLGVVATLCICSEPTAAGLIFLVGRSSMSIASVWYPCKGCCDKIWLALWTFLCMMTRVGWLAHPSKSYRVSLKGWGCVVRCVCRHWEGIRCWA